MDKGQDKAKDATKSDNFRINGNSLNERIKTIEAYVNLNVADLESANKNELKLLSIQ